MPLLQSKPFRRARFDLFLRRQARTVNAAQAASINVVLSNRHAFDDVFNALNGEYESAMGAGVGGVVTDFLDWLLANAPAIIELVLQIVALFT